MPIADVSVLNSRVDKHPDS